MDIYLSNFACVGLRMFVFQLEYGIVFSFKEVVRKLILEGHTENRNFAIRISSVLLTGAATSLIQLTLLHSDPCEVSKAVTLACRDEMSAAAFLASSCSCPMSLLMLLSLSADCLSTDTVKAALPAA